MSALISAAIGHARTILSIMALLLLLGITAYTTIPKEASPDVAIPVIYVSINHEGISPRDAERLLVKPMETELRAIEGVKEMTSYAREGGASISLEFDAGFDADQALIDVREKVDFAKSELPEETDEPTVHEVNVSLFPVISILLSGDIPERTLMQVARNLRDDIESLPPVLEAQLRGDREEMLEILVDPAQIESYNLSANELIETVVRNNRLVAAGTLDTGDGSFSVKIPGLIEGIEDVANLPIKVDGDAVVTLSDIASVRRTFKDAATFSRINGKRAVSLDVVKRTGLNTIETVEAVKYVVAIHRQNWPASVEVNYVQNQAEEVESSLLNLQNNVLIAVLLVVIVTVGALGVRAAGLVGVAIPTSFLIAFAVLWAMGLTINIVVLFSLILAVGMLVDGAIVVTELADRKMAEGKPPREAYTLAAQRMAWPITASTMTTLAAFLPLLFWPGVVGKFMAFLPLTLITTLSGALVTALIFLPTLGALFGKPSTTDAGLVAALSAAEKGDVTRLTGFTGYYSRTIARLIRMPFRVLAVAVTILAGAWFAYGSAGNGIDFFPRVEPDFAQLQVRARGNLSTQERDLLVQEVENIAAGIDGIEMIYGRTLTPEAAGSSDYPRDLIGTVQLQFEDWGTRPPVNRILTQIRERSAQLPGIVVQAYEPQNGPETGKDIQIEVASRVPELLPGAIATIRRHLEEDVGGLIEIEDSRPLPGIEFEIEVDRAQAGRFSTDVVTVGSAIQLVTNGIKVGEYRPDDVDDEIDIRARFPTSERNIDEIDHLRLQTPAGLMPISNFIKRVPRQRTGAIERVDGLQAMTIKANVIEGILPDTKVREISAWLDTAELDERLQIRFRGQNEEQEQASSFLIKALFATLLLMAIILVTQFNSFYHAFLILTAVIMSTVGVAIGLLVTGRSFVIVMTGIGIIALAGIVVNNNIVLIDTFAHLRRQGFELYDAIVRTGAQRLRPVLLTTVTTIVGLMPMVFQVNVDLIRRNITIGEPDMVWWTDLSTAIVFGLSFATLLTLVVTPCLLAAPDVLKKQLGLRDKSGVLSRQGAAAE